MLIIADSSPLHYLLLIGHIDIVPTLYERIIVPAIVIVELCHRRTPAIVRDWVEARPEWVDVQQPHLTASGSLAELDDGERDAILLAMELEADLLLLDDRRARVEATRQRLPTTGTLGVLQAASRHDLLNLPEALSRLLETNFRVDQALIDALLARDAGRSGEPPSTV
jgi:predicted nucleic acid-binding protein